MSGGNGKSQVLSLRSLDARVEELEDERDHYNETLQLILGKQDAAMTEFKLARRESEAVHRKVDEILMKINAVALALKLTER